MLKQIVILFKPTRYKVVASICITLAYIIAAFFRILSARVFLVPFDASSSIGVLLIIVNWIILAFFLYATAFFVFSKKRLLEYSLERSKILALVTILGLLLSYAFFEMPRLLSFIFIFLASDGGAGSLVFMMIAWFLLSYILFSLLMYFMERFKNKTIR